MIIDLVKLKSGIVNEITIDEIVEFSSEDLTKSGIIELKDTKVVGNITKNDTGYHLNIEIKGTMVLPCSLTLKPTNHLFSIKIDDDLDELLDETVKKPENDENTLDIFPIIWENILMEIPMRVVNEDMNDVKLKGEGWEVVTDKKENESVNPELLKLQELLK